MPAGRLKLSHLAAPLLGGLAGGLLGLLRLAGLARSEDGCAWLARHLGPHLREHRIGRAQLQAAFPERDAAWVEATLLAAWDNLGRVVGEYAHLDRIWDFDLAHPGTGRIETDAAPAFFAMRDDGQPALLFAAHLANWELPAVAARAHGLASAVVYRMPNNRHVAARIAAIRSGLMGRLIPSRATAALEMAAALERGEHLGMLVDQHWARGVDVTFFGRRCKANPTLPRLARQFDCPVYGVRMIRLPGRRFRLSVVGPVELPRDAGGQVDVAASCQVIAGVVEGWVREYPAQWLWFHRRWR